MKFIVIPDKGILEESRENLPCVPLNMWACALPKIFSLYVQGAAGRMQSFAVRSPCRKHESLPLQCPLFLKEVCDIVLCAVQTQ